MKNAQFTFTVCQLNALAIMNEGTALVVKHWTSDHLTTHFDGQEGSLNILFLVELLDFGYVRLVRSEVDQFYYELTDEGRQLCKQLDELKPQAINFDGPFETEQMVFEGFTVDKPAGYIDLPGRHIHPLFSVNVLGHWTQEGMMTRLRKRYTFDEKAQSGNGDIPFHFEFDKNYHRPGDFSGYRNAFWNGREMSYGEGSDHSPFFAVDGVIRHEIGHGIPDNLYVSGDYNRGISEFADEQAELDALRRFSDGLLAEFPELHDRLGENQVPPSNPLRDLPNSTTEE